MGNCSTAVRVGEAVCNRLNHVEVVEHVVKAAVVGESVEKIATAFLAGIVLYQALQRKRIRI